MFVEVCVYCLCGSAVGCGSPGTWYFFTCMENREYYKNVCFAVKADGEKVEGICFPISRSPQSVDEAYQAGKVLHCPERRSEKRVGKSSTTSWTMNNNMNIIKEGMLFFCTAVSAL